MARPRNPVAKAKTAGREIIHAGRYKDRKEPKVTAPVGNAPRWMSADQVKVWLAFTTECPWLNGSHRGLLEVAVPIRARLWAGEEVGVQALNLLRQCLGQMGATPADASKVSVPDETEDPDEHLFNRPN